MTRQPTDQWTAQQVVDLFGQHGVGRTRVSVFLCGRSNALAAILVSAGVSLERLCRYAARAPLANARLSQTADGRIVYELKRPWRDGPTPVVFDPITFLERLAALVPRPRKNLVTYHGVLAPAAGIRDRIVPVTLPTTRAKAKASRKNAKDQPATCHGQPHQDTRRYDWAQLMRRLYEVDVLRCPCGARRQIIAWLTDPPVVAAILRCLGLPTQPPSIAKARRHRRRNSPSIPADSFLPTPRKRP